MSSFFLKLKGFKDATHQQPAGRSEDDDQCRGSSDSSSSASTTESRRSRHVLGVLKAFNLKNLKTVKDVALVGLEGEPIDDRTYLMERIIQLAADLPVSSRTSATLTNAFLNQLWTDLQHPPLSYLGQEFIFRKADGSGNNILWPHLGAVGQPYARTIRPRLMQPVARPDPGLIFDSLLVRKNFTSHPNQISSVLFYVATIIIHDIFHTSHDDYNISETSSYLDLAPLYGSSQDQQNNVRSMHDGKLKPDCFSDVRILGFPPGVGVLLIMFNRFHNHVAEHLALIDENKRFSSILHSHGTSKVTPEVAYDEALFQTARLVTTGLYINIVMKDYVRTILNLNRVDSAWNLDPRSEEGKAIFGHKIPEATGNSVSAEFNLVYRWHSCVSERDEEWTKSVYHRLFGDHGSRSMGEFLNALNDWAKTIKPDPLQREFAGLQRLSSDYYPDEQLAAIWTDSVSDVAGRYGAGHVPEVLRNVEILGIIQSRSWNLATLNEFRAYFKLQPHEKFEDINPDPVVAEQLRHLYGHPNNVEIYPGIVIEAAKKPKKPGSGLCTNFTTSRAILSDAVALVRGDRFYTVDYTPANLTNWGFEEANYDASIDYGCVLYKLVLTALPNSYRQDSIYAHYPLVIPSENKSILHDLGKASLYHFDKPSETPPPVTLASVEACKAVVNDAAAFEAIWDPATFTPLHLSKTEGPAHDLAQELLDMELFQSATIAFYKDTIANLIQDRSYQLTGIQEVDIVHEVFNVAHARFVAHLMLLPLGSKGKSHAKKYDDWEIMSLLSAVYTCADAEPTPAHQFAITVRRQKAITLLAEQIQGEVENAVKAGSALHSHSTVPIQNCALKAVQATSKGTASAAQIVWERMLPLAARLFVAQSRSFAEGLDYVLGEGHEQFQEVQQLPDLADVSAHDQLQALGRAASRHSPANFFSKKTVLAKAITDGSRQHELSPGQLVICRMEPPDSMDNPPAELGGQMALEATLSSSSFTATLEILSRLKNLSRAKGPTGQIRRFKQDSLMTYLNVEESAGTSHPVSMKVNWQA